MADLFGEMRGLLARGPSVRVFEELCTLLERCDERSQRREGIDYLEAQLSRWPDEIERIAPVHWSWRAFVGEDVPELALANKCFISEDTPDDALESLLSSPHVRNLRRLRIGRQLSHEAIDVLHCSPGAPQLTELHISCPVYNEGDFSRLFEEQESLLLPRLQKLHIFPATDGNALLEVSRDRIFSCAWPRLRRLELKSCGLGDPQAQALSEIEAPALEALLLTHNPITEVGAKALSSSSLLDGLREFDFHSCPIQEDGLRALFEGPGLTGVNRLHLFSHTLSSELAEAFASFTRRSRLSSALFYRCDFEEGALESLVQGCALEELHIMRCELDDGDIQQIVRSPLMQGLERLILEGGEVSPETAKMLLEANPAKLTHVGFDPVLLGEDELRAYLERGWLWGRHRRRFEKRLRVITKKAP